MPAALPGRLLMLLSSERSGSTLLRVMLGGHSHIVAPPELFLMRYADYATWRTAKPVAFESLAAVFQALGAPRPAEEIDAACRERTTLDVYRWLLDTVPPGHILVDKTPAYANERETLRRSQALEPFYLWLIRHPLGIIDSHVAARVPGGAIPALLQRVRDHLATLAGIAESDLTMRIRLRETRWAYQQTNILHLLEGVPDHRKCVVLFEDLVRDPAAALGPLFDRLGLALEPAVLAPMLERQNPELGDRNLHTHDGLDASKASAWRARFPEETLKPETLALWREIAVPSSAVRAAT